MLPPWQGWADTQRPSQYSFSTSESKSEPDPLVDEALTRVYMMTHRLFPAKMVIERWIRDAPSDGRPFLWLTEFDRRVESDNSTNLEKHYREAFGAIPNWTRPIGPG